MCNCCLQVPKPHTCTEQCHTSYVAVSTSKLTPKFASIGSSQKSTRQPRPAARPTAGGAVERGPRGAREHFRDGAVASGVEGGRRKCSWPVPAEGPGLLPDGVWRRPTPGALASGSVWRRRRREPARRSSSLRPCSVSSSTTPSWGPKRERYRRWGESGEGQERPGPVATEGRGGGWARLPVSEALPAARTRWVSASPRRAREQRRRGQRGAAAVPAPRAAITGALSGQRVKCCSRGLGCCCRVRDKRYPSRCNLLENLG